MKSYGICQLIITSQTVARVWITSLLMRYKMEQFMQVLGNETAKGLLELVYDLILEEIKAAAR